MTKFLTALMVFITCVSLLWASDDRGIGGTGKYSDPEDRGLGGTGKTAVIGTITAFGSIWVNGIEIEFNQDTEIKMDGQNSNNQALRLGQQVQVLASQNNEDWYAETILIDHALIGRLALDTNQTWNIQGVNIEKDPNIPGEWPDLKPNDYVKVSGYFDQHVFYATDITPAIDNGTWKVSAPVTLTKTGEWTLGKHELPSEVLDAKSEETITLEGSYTTSGNRLARIYYHKNIPFAQQSRHYIVEKRRPSRSESIEYSPEALKQTLTPTHSKIRTQKSPAPHSSFFNEVTPAKEDRINAWRQITNEGQPDATYNRNDFGQLSSDSTFGGHADRRSGGPQPSSRKR